ncbi:P-loop containing nucleoside triphosphate hydrolase protein [Bombardia bombarda]|uniref:ATP-dependent RNA helicase n=1 Tax=Bombardia bombarda TaxID=252184 RepID=A0AA40CEM8_9PEZI|nr:P-loop containing nucleoside triphosphate hydrolase protein [Bombardia bombarda]
MEAIQALAASERVPFTQLAGRLQPQLLKALEQMKYEYMSPVQKQVLSLPTFTQDCLVQAKTGTGKTIAFLLPALHTLLTTRGLPRGQVGVLVLAPTRELAQQIADECNKLTSQCNPAIECHIAVGGSSRKSNMDRFLRGNPTILVATPGRLMDYLGESAPKAKFTNLRTLVLDEADRMLDQGFAPALIKILELMPSKASAGWQGMCFSATMPPEINKLLHHVLKPNHVRISTIDANEAPTVDAIPQSLLAAKSIEDVFPALHNLLACERIDNPKLKAIIFSSTARQAALMYHIFASTGGAAPGKLPVYQMHSRLSQPARNRTVEEFKATDRGLLFASDVVGRGMDFPDIGLVVQIGLPSDKEQYVHRVGRTGRAGKAGRAVMVLIPEEMSFIRHNRQFPIKENLPAHPKSTEIPSNEIIARALANIPEVTKAQAYVAFLGFTKTLKKVHGLDSPAVVQLANRFSGAMGLAEPPVLEPSTVGKMGLKGVPGLIIRGKGDAPTRYHTNARNPILRGNANANANGNNNKGGNKQGNKTPLDDSSQSSPAGNRKRPRREAR